MNIAADVLHVSHRQWATCAVLSLLLALLVGECVLFPLVVCFRAVCVLDLLAALCWSLLCVGFRGCAIDGRSVH